jgi:hypothetical protein
MKTVTYTLMLIAMTYNGGIILIMIFSLGLANFGFAMLGDHIYIKSRLNKIFRKPTGSGGIGDTRDT